MRKRDGWQRIGWALCCAALLRVAELALAARFLALTRALLELADHAKEKAFPRP